jgi:septal ring factor EnvC (AmiA/AmiB activator)
MSLGVIAQRSGRKAKSKNVDRVELEQQRVSLLAEIKETQAKLLSLQKDKNASLQQLNAIQQKLTAREALIGNINKDIFYLNNNITEAKDDAQNLEKELNTLKEKYAELVRYSYKKRTAQSILLFLFNSHSFNDALKRYKYIKQYRDYRKAQSNKILHTSNELLETITELNERKMEKDMMRKSEEEQRLSIAQEQSEKAQVVNGLKDQESKLITEISKKQRTAAELTSAISAAIKREIELARKKAEEERRRIAKAKAEEEKRAREAEKKLALEKRRQEEERARLAREAEAERAREAAEIAKKNKSLKGKGAKEINKEKSSSPKAEAITSNKKNNIPEIPKTTKETEPTKELEPSKRVVPVQSENATANVSEPAKTNYADDLDAVAKNLSINFEQNRGSLPSPVSGYIISHFGKSKHHTFNVYEENKGIDIRTAKGTVAKTVFAGEVASVFYIAGTGNNILVNHGNYFTVYSRIDKVSVTKGQKINARTPIGTVLTDGEGNTQVHFEIWKVGTNNVPVNVNPEQWIRF